MAIKGQPLVAQVLVWDTATNSGKAGDTANLTLAVIRDGVAGSRHSAAALSEPDATNAPGVVAVPLDATDMDAGVITVAGRSGTAGVVVIPTQIITEAGRLDVAVSTRSTLTAAGVWEHGTRTLSSVGGLVADVVAGVWGAGSRTLTSIADSAGVTTLLSRLTAAWAARLDVAVSTVGSPGGTGGNPVSITLVDTAGAPVPGLTVTVWNSAVTVRLAYGTTDANGTLVVNLDAGPVIVAVSTTTVWQVVGATAYTVTDAGAQSVPDITLTAQSVTPPAGAGQITGILDTYDAQGALEAGVAITLRMVEGPHTAGQSHDTGEITATSNGSGRVSVALLKGARYKARRGTSGAWVSFTAPTAGASCTLPEVLGTP